MELKRKEAQGKQTSQGTIRVRQGGKLSSMGLIITPSSPSASLEYCGQVKKHKKHQAAQEETASAAATTNVSLGEGEHGKK